ncbi:MAG: aldo/keto reductase [Ignavibacteriales bacterium]|nr:MAG: aldo/keto reductase [Ignavibacteriales bacterium]
MPLRELGKTGINVTILGFGAGQIGDNSISEKETEFLLNSVLDLGINFIDTARGYGLSEERIGKYISNRRSEYILSTKVGYGIDGIQDWTYDCIVAGVEYALKLLKTDYIDVVHLHTCPLQTLLQGDVINALHRCIEKGKIRAAAYSGENSELECALTSGQFESVQTSVNIFDQSKLSDLVPMAVDKKIGIVGKRPLGNTPWKYKERPVNHYSEIYWERMKKMKLDFGEQWAETALRFSVFSEGITTCITGTKNFDHLKENSDHVLNGALPAETYNLIRGKFQECNEGWVGQV